MFMSASNLPSHAHPSRRRWLGQALALGAAPWVHRAGAQTAAGPEAGVLRFSPVNQYGIQLTAAYWNPIIRHVSERSGQQLQLKIGRTSADTTAYVLAQEVEIVFSNHLFSPERERLGWRVFGRRLTPPVHSQVLVFADSPITQLAELTGREVAFPGPEALVAYKMAAAQLVAQQVDFKTVFGGNMDGAFAQLASGKVAAVGANSQLAEGYTKREGRAFRALWTSQPLHDLALMASSKVSDAARKAVAQAFVGMGQDKRGREVLAQASAQVGLPADAGFVASDGAEYGAYRDFYRNAPAHLK